MPEYQNPQQQPGTEKRLLLVFAITFVVLMLSQPFLKRFMPQSEPAKPAPAQQQQAQPAQPAAQPAPTPAAPTAKAPAKKPATGAAVKQAGSESETVFDTDLYRITFTNKGAYVKSWILKKYHDDKGNPLELINPIAAPQHGYPLSLWTGDADLRAKLNSALYVPSVTGVQKTGAVSFEYSDGDVTVRKSFKLDESYVVNIETSVLRNGQPVPAYPAWPGGFGDQTVPQSYAASRIDYQSGDKVERLTPDKKGEAISGGKTLRMPMFWGGPVDQYFSAVFMPAEPANAEMVTLRNTIHIPQNLDRPDPNKMTPVEVLGAAVGSSNGPTTRVRLFAGPNSLDVLNNVHATGMGGTVGPNLGAIVDFGKWFGFIAKPLFIWLKWTQEHMISNWGWAIAFLTLVINLALLPLRVSSMKSALKMQRVQPKVNDIKKRYEKYGMRDPRRQEMNQEIAALFKQEGVNPAGGCLPMIIQMPFLIAFYSMLGVAIELRHAHWLWVKDLAAPDPYHILPIAIIISTFLMQKFTPATGMDPNQQRMMNIMMPVMLGVFSWSVAAGLGVYWVIGTIIAIIQQYVMNRTELGREMHAIAEKRARKQGVKV